jgi:cytochrome c-type biogenesis protein CcmE
MTPARRQRLILVGLVLAGVATAVTVGSLAFKENLSFFMTPSDIAANAPPQGTQIRLGGLVEAGTVARTSGSLEVFFAVTDGAQSLQVRFDQVLPDLFSEGKGVVAVGVMGDDGVFHASEVLAKHDENYMPPEVAAALARAHEEATGTPVPAELSEDEGSADTSVGDDP